MVFSLQQGECRVSVKASASLYARCSHRKKRAHIYTHDIYSYMGASFLSSIFFSLSSSKPSKSKFLSKIPVPLKSILLRILWFCTRVPAKFILRLLCVYKVRPRSEENLKREKQRTMTTRDSLLMLKQFGNVSATERKQRRRKVSAPSALLKKMHSKSVSAPNWMRTERTDMRVRFEAASAKNAEAMTSNRDEKHLYVFVLSLIHI